MAKFSFLIALICASVSIFGQNATAPGSRSQEISDDDGLPVLIKHLPDWESSRQSTVFIKSPAELRTALGGRPVLGEIDFAGGTEAVTAAYPAGRLLIVEFTSPQASSEADNKILKRLVERPEPGTVYRRIGNYNVFVFDAPDETAASALLDRVKYEKNVQWLGEDPFLIKKFERYFVTTTRDIFISTVLWIVGGLGISLVCGLLIGVIFFSVRNQRRAGWHAYSDAGGLTRLNLDDLSE